MALPWYDDPQPGMLLSLGSGPGDRLLAPGVPDQLLADGHRIGWLSRGALVLLDPDRTGARLVVVGEDPESLATSPERWVLAHEGGLEIFSPETGRTGLVATDLVDDLVQVLPGGALAVLRTAAGNRAVVLPTGEELTLPLGARKARILLPWSDGTGLVWIDDDSLYRWSPDRGVTVCGHLPDRVEALVPGPHGALFASLAGGGCLVAGSGRQATALEEEVLAPSASFDAQGARLLATTATGATCFDLRSGAAIQRWPGRTSPVGFAPDPVRFDESQGLLLGPEGEVLLSHLGLAGVSVDVPLMVGPGGTAWDLSRGEAAWADAPLNGGVTLADDDRVLHLGERRATLYDDEGTVRNSWRIPLFPETATENLLQTVRTGGGEEAEITNEVAEAAWLGSQVALLTLEGEAALVDVATGELLQRFESVQYEETDGWPGLLPHRRRGVWLRDGEGGLLLPEGSILPDPGEEVEALCPAGRDLIRAVGDRLERLGEDGQVAWTTPMMAHLLALGRHLFVASGDDLVLLDPESGTVRRRAKGGLADMEGFAATSDGHLWAWGGTEGPAAVRCLDGDTGAHRRSWEIPADGVVTSSGSAWIWTDDGMLVQLAR